MLYPFQGRRCTTRGKRKREERTEGRRERRKEEERESPATIPLSSSTPERVPALFVRLTRTNYSVLVSRTSDDSIILRKPRVLERCSKRERKRDREEKSFNGTSVFARKERAEKRLR